MIFNNKKIGLKITIEPKKQILEFGTSEVVMNAIVKSAIKNNKIVSFKWYKFDEFKNHDEALKGKD